MGRKSEMVAFFYICNKNKPQDGCKQDSLHLAWGDGTVGNVRAVQAWGSEFDPQNTYENLGKAACVVYNPSAGKPRREAC